MRPNKEDEIDQALESLKALRNYALGVDCDGDEANIGDAVAHLEARIQSALMTARREEATLPEDKKKGNASGVPWLIVIALVVWVGVKIVPALVRMIDRVAT